MFDIKYFPSNAIQRYVLLERPSINKVVMSSLAVTPSRTQNIETDSSVASEAIDGICGSCQIQNYKAVHKKIKDDLLKSLEDEDRLRKARRKLIDVGYDSVENFTIEEVLSRLDWEFGLTGNKVKDYYSKHTDRCPGISRAVSWGFMEGITIEPCRAGHKLDKTFDINVPELMWLDKQHYCTNFLEIESSDNAIYAMLSYEVEMWMPGRDKSLGGMISAYPYQLANVYGTGKVCWGEQGEPHDLRSAQSTFFTSKFNTDLVLSAANVRSTYESIEIDKANGEYNEDEYEGTIYEYLSLDDYYPNAYEHLRNYSAELLAVGRKTFNHKFSYSIDCHNAVGILVCLTPELPGNVIINFTWANHVRRIYFTTDDQELYFLADDNGFYRKKNQYSYNLGTALTVALITRLTPDEKYADLRIPLRDGDLEFKNVDLNFLDASASDLDYAIRTKIEELCKLFGNIKSKTDGLGLSLLNGDITFEAYNNSLYGDDMLINDKIRQVDELISGIHDLTNTNNYFFGESND